jgi:hypothetical protein
MIGRRAVVRRRPLLRTAAIGGGAFMAGRAAGRRSEQAYAGQDDQDQGSGAMEQQQAAGQQPGPAQSAAPGPSAVDQLSQLSTLHQQGALTDDEFAAAKAQILGS